MYSKKVLGKISNIQLTIYFRSKFEFLLLNSLINIGWCNCMDHHASWFSTFVRKSSINYYSMLHLIYSSLHVETWITARSFRDQPMFRSVILKRSLQSDKEITSYRRSKFVEIRFSSLWMNVLCSGISEWEVVDQYGISDSRQARFYANISAHRDSAKSCLHN